MRPNFRLSHFTGEVCFKCVHRHASPEDGVYCDIDGEFPGGDAQHVCDLFTLDRTRYYSLDLQRWEARRMGLTEGGQTSLDGWTSKGADA